MVMKLPKDVREYFKRQGATGGKKRARNLTAEERSESARKAAQTRWAKLQPKSAPEQTGGKK